MRRTVCLLLALLLVPHAQAADLQDLQATSLHLQGVIGGGGTLGILQARDAQDGQTSGAPGVLFRLQAQTLRVETDAVPVAAVAGAHVPGEVQKGQRTFTDAELRAVQSHADHSLVVLPGKGARAALVADGLGLAPEPAATFRAEHYVDPDRGMLAARLPPSVRATDLQDGTLVVEGDLTLVLWSWSFLVQEGGATTQYRTGYDGGDSVTGPQPIGEVAGVGQRVQAYIRATDATLTFLPGAGNLEVLLLDPSFSGVSALTASTVTGTLEGAPLLSDELELHGDAMDVRLEHARAGVLAIQVDGADAYRISGGPVAQFTPAAPPAYIWALAAVPMALAVAGIVVARTSPERLLGVAAALARRGHLRLACGVLRLHLRRSPESVTGLTLLAETEGRRRRFAKELDVRHRAAQVLVDRDRVHNARRVLHLYARLGRDEEALTWFEACKGSDLGLVQEMIAEPVFRDIDQRLRKRAGRLLGWDDPTGV